MYFCTKIIQDYLYHIYDAQKQEDTLKKKDRIDFITVMLFIAEFIAITIALKNILDTLTVFNK